MVNGCWGIAKIILSFHHRISTIAFIITAILFSLISVSSVLASPQVLSFTHNGTDNYYYDGQNVYFFANVSEINASFLPPPTNVTLNCSYLGGMNYQNVQGVYVAGDNRTNTRFSFTCPLNYSNTLLAAVASGPVTPIPAGVLMLLAINSTPSINTTAYTGTIYTYNFTVPVMPPGQPVRFGALTTNLATQSNLANVNYIIEVEGNGSDPLFGSGDGWDGYSTIALYNFTSLNMTTSDIATQLGALAPPSGINVNISLNSSIPSSIFLNSTALGVFNTTTTLTLYHLPFTSLPNVTTDGDTQASSLSYAYDAVAEEGNLTFTASHFTTYNATDLIAPVITVYSPTANQNISSSNMLINVSFNGTSSSINNNTITVTVTNSSGSSTTYTYANFTCTSANDDELVTCNRTSAYVDGTYTVTFNVTDFGAGAGNRAGSVISNVTIDSTPPRISLISPANASSTNSTSMNFTFNATDAHQVGLDCNLFLDKPADQINFNISSINMSASSVNTSTITGIAVGLHNWTVECFDYPFGNYNYSVTWFFTVTASLDTTSPSVTLVSPSAGASSANLTQAFNCTATDDVRLSNITLFVWNSTGSVVNQTAVAATGTSNSSALTVTLPYADAFRWNCQAYDNSSNAAFASANRTLTVDTTAPTFDAIADQAISYGSSLSVQITNANDASGIGGYSLNDTVRFSVNGTGYITNSTALAAGIYGLIVTVNDTVGNTLSRTFRVTVNQATPTLNLSTSTGSWSTSYGTAVTVNCTASTSQVNATLYRNGTYVGSSESSSSLAAGFYAYVCSNSATQNYTAGTSQSNNLTVTQVSTTVSLALNGASADLTVTYPQTINATFSTSNLTATMYRNGTNVNAQNNSAQTLAAGYYNYTVVNAGNANYSGSTVTYFVTVSKNTSGLALSSSAGWSITSGTSTTVNCSSGTSQITNATLYRDGVSLNGTNETVALADGTYTYVCNSTSTPQNYTTSTSQTLTVSTASSGGGSGGGGGGGSTLTYSTGDLTGSEGEFSLSRGDQVKFQHSGEPHSIKLQQVGSDWAKMEISSSPQTITVYKGKSTNVDLNSDGKNDIAVKLVNILYNKVLIEVTSLVTQKSTPINVLPPAKTVKHELEVVEKPLDTSTAVPEASTPADSSTAASAPALSPAPAPIAEPPVEKKSGSMLAFGILLAVAVVIVIIAFVIGKKRKE